jgi:hypothetical protein
MAGRAISLILAGALITTASAAVTASAATATPGVVLAVMQVRPTSGPGGTVIHVRAKELSTFHLCRRSLYFEDSAGTVTFLQTLPLTDTFTTTATIPAGAALGSGTVYVQDVHYRYPLCSSPVTVIAATASFTVT